MKNLFRFTLALFVTLLVAGPALAKAPKASGPTSFDKLKDLSGTWTTTTDMDGKQETFKMNYKVTSGGSALEETLFAGSPKEMISMYTVDQGKVLMTHYCMMGNQPRLQEVSSTKNQIKLDMRDATGMSSPNDPHMGGLTVTFKDKNHIEQAWTHYNADGTSQVSVFQWEREK
jgi:hypothetical protein